MVSDNAPPMDQLQVAFPFSLGSRLGRNYQFTQFAATFEDTGTRKYFEGRRLEYTFSPRLTADFQEAFISSSSRSLEVTLTPDVYTGQSANLNFAGLKIRGLDQDFNSFATLGMTYNATPDTRFYGQFGIDDIGPSVLPNAAQNCVPGRHVAPTPARNEFDCRIHVCRPDHVQFTYPGNAVAGRTI